MATNFAQPSGWLARTAQDIMNPIGWGLKNAGIAKEGTFVNNLTNLGTGAQWATLGDYWTNEPGHKINNLRDVAGAARHFFQTGLNDSMDEAMWKYVAPGIIGAYNQGLGAAAGAFGGALSEAEHGEGADSTTGDFVGSMLQGVGAGLAGGALGDYLGVGAAEGAAEGAAIETGTGAAVGAGGVAVEAGTGATATEGVAATSEAPSTLELLAKTFNAIPLPKEEPQAQPQPQTQSQPQAQQSQAVMQAQQQQAKTERQLQKLKEDEMARRENTTLMGIPGTETTPASVVDGGPIPTEQNFMRRLLGSISKSYADKPHIWAKVMDQLGSGLWSREQGNPFAGIGTQLAEASSMSEAAQAEQAAQVDTELAMYQAIEDLLMADEAVQTPSALRQYSLMEPRMAGDYLSGRRTF